MSKNSITAEDWESEAFRREHREQQGTHYVTNKEAISVPDCFSLTGMVLDKPNTYVHISCYGEGLQSQELWIHQDEPVAEEVIKQIEYTQGGMTMHPHLNDVEIRIQQRTFHRIEIKDDGSEVWSVSQSSAVGGWSREHTIKDGAVIDTGGLSESIV